MRIRIKVEKCIDADSWVWSLVDEYNGVICDGYSESESDALSDARQRRREELEWRDAMTE
jgi:hypothetical protein